MNAIQTLLTDHLDIWTAADTEKKSGRGRSSGNADRVYGIRKLRELILELAVRGKLVPQDPNDEPASALLPKVLKENARLLKERNKKPNEAPEITDGEITFQLPKGWEYVRSGSLFSLRKGKKPTNISESEIGLPYLDIEALDRNNVLRFTDDDKCPRTTEADILVVCDGSRSGLVLEGKNGIIGSTLAVIDTPKLIQPFIKLLFKESYERMNSAMKGAAIPHLDTSRLILEVVGLPPLNEQYRIIAKVDELMAMCDQLEQQQTHSIEAHQTLVETLLGTLTHVGSQQEFSAAWARIASHFDTLFTTEASIEQLKQTLLQLAVMGKLIPQDPRDEPASGLVNNVTELRKLKNFSAISEAEAPFKVSISWRWVRFGDFLEVTSSKRIHVSDYATEGIPFFRSKEIGELKRGQPISSDIFISIEKFESLKSLSGFPRAGDLMLTSVGSIGNTWICDGRDFYYKDGNITKIGSHKYADMRFVQCFIESPLFSNQVTDTVSGTAYNALTIIKLNNLYFPLPP